MNWVSVPAQRVLQIHRREFDLFERRNEDGSYALEGQKIALFIRKADGRVFRWADIQPGFANMERDGQIYFLVEL
jgi:hypothetical protein